MQLVYVCVLYVCVSIAVFITSPELGHIFIFSLSLSLSLSLLLHLLKPFLSVVFSTLLLPPPPWYFLTPLNLVSSHLALLPPHPFCSHSAFTSISPCLPHSPPFLSSSVSPSTFPIYRLSSTLTRGRKSFLPLGCQVRT